MGTSPVVERGAVVLVRFPFSDLSASKFRPAVVLASVGQGDHILVQVTSRPYGDGNAVELGRADFDQGGLQRMSYARPGKIFTANETLVDRMVGRLSSAALEQLVVHVVRLLRNSAQESRL